MTAEGADFRRDAEAPESTLLPCDFEGSSAAFRGERLGELLVEVDPEADFALSLLAFAAAPSRDDFEAGDFDADAAFTLLAVFLEALAGVSSAFASDVLAVVPASFFAPVEVLVEEGFGPFVDSGCRVVVEAAAAVVFRSIRAPAAADALRDLPF